MRRGNVRVRPNPPQKPSRTAKAVSDEATMTKFRPTAPRDGVLTSDAATSVPKGAQKPVTRSVQGVKAGSKQDRLREARERGHVALDAPAKGKPLRILVVEDDGMIATLLAETLEAMGYEICAIATTQAQAVSGAARHRPDLLLVDFHLATGSGAAAVAEILLGGSVAHIYMTGDALTADGIDLGVTILRKPFQDYDLARAIDAAFVTKPAT